ncbi:MAG: HEAT repeat domain-containing protein [Verrucomicrobia subdivision 3 bacterium]|nr:HEAT repeat domain-containing protein [Limisphaerales bacterium]
MRFSIALCALAILTPAVIAEPPPALERYRNLEFPPRPENFDKGWRERVALEFEIINQANLSSLRAGLTDKNEFVRSMAARALGIRGDKASANALAEVARKDREFMVRIRAVESLGLLKMKAEVIEAAKKDRQGAVRWSADLAADQLKSKQDCAGQIRRAFAAGINRKKMGSAMIGQPAPDFTAQTLDGKPFKLSTVLGKKPIALYFAAFDQ